MISRRKLLAGAVAVAAAPHGKPEIPHCSGGDFIALKNVSGGPLIPKAGESWSISFGPFPIKPQRSA